MEFPVIVFAKADSPVPEEGAEEWARRLVEPELERFCIDTRDSRYLAPKKVSLSRYKRHYRSFAGHDMAQFEDWMKSVGCYRDADGAWSRDANMDGRFVSFKVGGRFSGYMPSKNGPVCICDVRDLSLRRDVPDSSVANRRYSLMTRTLPPDARLRESYASRYGAFPSISELGEYRERTQEKYVREAVESGCEFAFRLASENKRLFPTFEDYSSYCSTFVPDAYVSNGKWLENPVAMCYHRSCSREMVSKYVFGFSDEVKRLAGGNEDGWFAVCIEAHR